MWKSDLSGKLALKLLGCSTGQLERMSGNNGDFFSTEAGQFIAGAHRYFSAARALRFSELAETQGMELLFKYPLIRSGATQKQVTRQFGHDLHDLWLANGNEHLRRETLNFVRQAWDQAKSSGKWPNDDFSLVSEDVLVKAIRDLGHLHGRGSSFALRYTISRPTLAPRPAFLIEAFGEVTERTVKNPSFLDY